MVSKKGMRYVSFALLLVLLLAVTGASSAETVGPTVTVGIFSGRHVAACTVSCKTPIVVQADGAESPVTFPLGTPVRVLVREGGLIYLAADGTEVSAARVVLSSQEVLRVLPDGVAARAYRGTVTLSAKADSLAFINTVTLEDYLRGVLPGEMPASFSPEALKAQAIAARTYALTQLGRHRAEGCDLCDSTHCQVYQGAGREDARIDAAVSATAGIIVTYQGQPISAVYHDACGGQTASNEEVWPGATPAPYLRSVSDTWGVTPWCSAGPRATWTQRVPQEKVVAALAKLGVTGPLKLIAPEGCETGGRPKQYHLTGETSEWMVRASQFRDLVNRALGAETLRSADFTAILEGNDVVFTGHGSGHGVGLCQWGANALAKAGRTAPEILAHYYVGTQVEPMGTAMVSRLAGRPRG
jgi:stage II sporulation protein D